MQEPSITQRVIWEAQIHSIIEKKVQENQASAVYLGRDVRWEPTLDGVVWDKPNGGLWQCTVWLQANMPDEAILEDARRAVALTHEEVLEGIEYWGIEPLTLETPEQFDLRARCEIISVEIQLFLLGNGLAMDAFCHAVLNLTLPSNVEQSVRFLPPLRRHLLASMIRAGMV